jgi:thiol:disulfide interchange protein
MFKKNIPLIVLSLFVAILIVALIKKDKLNNYISEMMRSQVSPELIISVKNLTDSLYNYSKTGKKFEITILEFSSSGCTVCKQMEKELDEISSKYSQKVNVVFVNIMKPESQALMKYYGVVVTPAQILLDKRGNEFSRNSGFISAAALEQKFSPHIN